MSPSALVRIFALVAGFLVPLPAAVGPVVPARAETAQVLVQEDLSIDSGTHTHRFIVEVAATRAEQERGLMFRPALAADRGMLFDWGGMVPAAMWMKNTLIPLDMLFIAGDGTIVYIAENTTPGSLDVITAGVPVRAVLEMAGGTARRLGLKTGNRVRHRLFTAP